MRRALIKGGTPERVAAYMPSNYSVVSDETTEGVLIEGTDVAGWTLDDYVLPRLASGLMFGSEIQ